MYTSGVDVAAGVTITDRCEISYSLCDEKIEFMFGGRSGFDLLITPDILEQFIEQASIALRESREAIERDERER